MDKDSTNTKKIIIIVPCYNEAEVIKNTANKLQCVLNNLVNNSLVITGRILFVDDGSTDSTWKLTKEICLANHNTFGIKLSNNSGHQNALWAGIDYAINKLNANCIISIDADLQDDINSICEMVAKYNNGYEIVYGVRKSRDTDTFFKRQTALQFYSFMKKLGCDIQNNHADFRLLSRKAALSLLSFPERNLFLRGMVKSLGFNSSCVYYDRKERTAGVSKYPLKKMISFALDGITSFSVKPLRIIVIIGIMCLFISFLAICYGLYSYFVGKALPGWTSLLISTWFIGGAILTSLGIIGEYIGKIYNEVKRRPRYIIDETTNI